MKNKKNKSNEFVDKLRETTASLKIQDFLITTINPVVLSKMN